MPPAVTLSWENTPDTGPLPYMILNSVPFAVYVLLCVWSKILCVPDFFDGTHRLEEPVS